MSSFATVRGKFKFTIDLIKPVPGKSATTTPTYLILNLFLNSFHKSIDTFKSYSANFPRQETLEILAIDSLW